VANYALGIVAHVERQSQIDMLRERIYPDLIEVDDGTYGCMGNHCLTIEKLYQNGRRSGREWIVVLEDDAQPPETGFHQQVSAALDVAPSPIVSFYSGTGHPAQRQGKFAEMAARQDVHWILHANMRHAVAYALHVDVIELGLIDHMIKMSRERWAPDDAISKFARRHGIQVAYSNPSLVQHEDGPMMVKSRTSKGIPMINRRRPRKAHWVGTRILWFDNAGQV
jgi:hypothetical protein